MPVQRCKICGRKVKFAYDCYTEYFGWCLHCIWNKKYMDKFNYEDVLDFVNNLLEYGMTDGAEYLIISLISYIPFEEQKTIALNKIKYLYFNLCQIFISIPYKVKGEALDTILYLAASDRIADRLDGDPEQIAFSIDLFYLNNEMYDYAKLLIDNLKTAILTFPKDS